MDWLSILVTTVEAAIGLETVVYALAAIGINIQFGYAGLLNFGQAAFLGVAAYGMAVTVATFNLPFWLGIVIGLAAAVALAFLLGIPTLRLRADYLAIVTIAAAEIVRLIFRSVQFSSVFGGSDGRQGFADGFYAINPYSPGEYSIGPFGFNERVMWVLTVGWILVALCCVLVYMLMKSPWGRVLKAIREDEDAARSLGKNVYSYKMQSLIIGGIFGAFAGFIYGLSKNAVIPTDYATDTTFFAYTVLLVGGAARVFGPVVGAILFWGLISALSVFFTQATRSDLIPDSIMSNDQASLMRFIVLGLALMLLMIFRPQGIFGDRKELAIDGR